MFVANGLGASVTVLDKSLRRLAELDFQFQSLITTLYSTTESIEQEVTSADLVIGAVLVPGAEAPKHLREIRVHLARIPTTGDDWVYQEELLEGIQQALARLQNRSQSTP